MCVASGAGIANAPVCTPVSFVVQAKREDGANQTHGGDVFSVRVMKDTAVVRTSLALSALAVRSPEGLRLFEDFVAALAREKKLVADFLWELDRRHSGALTTEQLAAGLRSVGVSFSDGALRDLLMSLDGDGNAEIDYLELSSMLTTMTRADEPVAPTARDNGDGTYLVEYLLNADIGAFDVEVTLDHAHISGSPFKAATSRPLASGKAAYARIRTLCTLTPPTPSAQVIAPLAPKHTCAGAGGTRHRYARDARPPTHWSPPRLP
jgi:hypothetical protein